MITTLDPFVDEQRLSVLTVNHDELRVRVFAVEPADFSDYLAYLYRMDDPDRGDPSWQEVSDKKVQVSTEADAVVDTSLDLGGALDGEPGHVVVLVEPVPAVSPTTNNY